MNVTTLRVGQMAANCYLLTDEESRKTIIIDPGDDAEYISDHIAKLNGAPQAIVATHGHFDHLMGASALQLAYDIPCFLHPADDFLVGEMERSAKHFLSLRQVDPAPRVTPMPHEGLTVGKTHLSVIHIPGHTPGSVMLISDSDHAAFVGDTVFAGGGVGRTDFSYSDVKKFRDSVARIDALPPETMLYPGHGEPTSVRYEYAYHHR